MEKNSCLLNNQEEIKNCEGLFPGECTIRIIAVHICTIQMIFTP